MRVGVIGLGEMGRPIAGRLDSAGFDVWYYDRDATRMSLGFGHAADSASDLARECTVIATMLATAEQTEELYGSDVLSVARPGTVALNLSTTTVDSVRRIWAAADDAGVRFIDSPVLGNSASAERGDLHVLLGAATEDDFIASVRVVEPLCSRLTRCGGVGAATGLKLVVNGLLYAYLASLREALAITRDIGLSDDVVLRVLSASAAGNAALERYVIPTLAGEDVPGFFPLRYALKDIRYLVERHEALVPIFEAVRATYEQAVSEATADDPHTRLILMPVVPIPRAEA